jgi:hypothetical protein
MVGGRVDERGRRVSERIQGIEWKREKGVKRLVHKSGQVE